MKVHIQNFQSLADTEFEAAGLTVLVGRSNLGKSAALRAIEGALFNRPGDEFVRQGESSAVVTLTQVPTAAGETIDVMWEKGGGANKFTIDGELHAKVGTGAPAPLQQAGFKDIKVGAEEFRPQATTQFDPLFLLTKPGSVVSDVLSVVSRMAVLLNADRACTKDVKAVAAMLKVRQGDLAASRSALDEMAPLVAFHARVVALGARMEEAQRLEAATTLVKAVVEKRRRLLEARLAMGELPAPTHVPTDLGEREQVADSHVLAHRLLVQVPDVLPVATAVPEDIGTRWSHGQAEVEKHTRLARVAATLPEPVPEKRVAVAEVWTSKAVSSSEAVGIQQGLLKQMGAHQSAVRATSEETVRTTALLEQTMADLKICPLCERPMEAT